MKKTILNKKSKIIKPVVIRWEFTQNIDWNFILNDLKSEILKDIGSLDAETINNWYKDKVIRADITRAKRIKAQYDYIRDLQNDTSREQWRKDEIMVSANAVLERLIHE
jgi:hypothetical protein